MRYAVNTHCGRTCTLNANNLPGEAADKVHRLYEDGANRTAIRLYLLTQDYKVSEGAIGRHKSNHLERLHLADDLPKGKARTHIEILQQIIERGGQSLEIASTRISPEMTMKAIEMHHKMTEGSVWQDFLDAIGAMGDEDPPGPDENPDAIASEDEQAQGDVGTEVE